MIASLIYVFVASKINFNISNATTFAMRHQGPSLLDDRLPPDSPFIENTSYGSHSKPLCTVYATVSSFMFTTSLRST